jgi:hypothetical protein
MASSKFKGRGARLSRTAKRFSADRTGGAAGRPRVAKQSAAAGYMAAWEAGKISWTEYQRLTGQ